jgi:ABC-type bacteriocin/lantibiotic exporter with double-glycine peptidase domain
MRARTVPYVAQMEAADCGAACLASVLAYHGQVVPLAQVRSALGGAERGVSARDLLEAARRFGLRTRGVQVEVDQLAQLPTGAVLHWGMDHFVVLQRVGRRGIAIVDPGIGPRLIPTQELLDKFTGVALIFEPEAHFEKRAATGGAVRRYLARLGKFRPLLRRIIALSVVFQLLAVALPVAIGAIVDAVIGQRRVELLWILAAGLAGVLVFHTASYLLRAILLNYLRSSFDAELSLGFVHHLSRLPFSFFVTRSTGDLLARFESNRNLRQTLSAAALSAILDGGLVLGYLAALLWLSLPLGFLVVLFGVLQTVTFVMLREPLRSLAAREIEHQGRAQNKLVEILGGIETIKSSGAAGTMVERWSHAFVDELNVSLERARFGSIAGSISSFLSLAAPMTLIVFGAHLVLAGKLSLGTMLALNALAAGFLQPLANLIAIGFQLQEARGHIERIDDVLETPVEVSGQHIAGTLHGSIELQQVSFRYGKREPWVVQQVDLKIAPGQRVAIVGRSGAGKSTLARLIVGLYRPEQGRVLFDDHDLTALDLDSVRRQIGVVTQDARLFAGSVRENITLGRENVTLGEAESAATLAAIHDEISNWSMGYDTVLADSGGSLSGGQRQRIALARALVARPAILLLDEATSEMDALTESRVTQSLRQIAPTQVVVAHRLSTIQEADLIVVLDRGQIVESGQHDQLLDRGGVYAQLVTAQRS